MRSVSPCAPASAVRLFEDDPLAFLALENDESAVQPLPVVRETGHRERVRGQEPVSPGPCAEVDRAAPEIEPALERLAGEDREDVVKRPDPAEAGAAPAHAPRPRQLADRLDQQFRQDGPGFGAGLFQGDEQEGSLRGFALLHLVARPADGFQETGDGALRGIDPGAAAFGPDVRLAQWQAVHPQRQPARRDMGFRVPVVEAAPGQPVGDQSLQVVGGPRLHAGGNFLREQFEQQFSHGRPAAPSRRRRRRSRLRSSRARARAPGRCRPGARRR